MMSHRALISEGQQGVPPIWFTVYTASIDTNNSWGPTGFRCDMKWTPQSSVKQNQIFFYWNSLHCISPWCYVNLVTDPLFVCYWSRCISYALLDTICIVTLASKRDALIRKTESRISASQNVNHLTLSEQLINNLKGSITTLFCNRNSNGN